MPRDIEVVGGQMKPSATLTPIAVKPIVRKVSKREVKPEPKMKRKACDIS